MEEFCMNREEWRLMALSWKVGGIATFVPAELVDELVASSPELKRQATRFWQLNDARRFQVAVGDTLNN